MSYCCKPFLCSCLSECFGGRCYYFWLSHCYSDHLWRVDLGQYTSLAHSIHGRTISSRHFKRYTSIQGAFTTVVITNCSIHRHLGSHLQRLCIILTKLSVQDFHHKLYRISSLLYTIHCMEGGQEDKVYCSFGN